MTERKTPIRLPMQFRSADSSPLGAITVAGFAVPQTVSLARPRVLGQYALVYLLDGEGSYRDANGWEQNLTAGDLILVFPDLEHIYNPRPGTAWVTTFLCFTGPIFDLWRSAGVLDSRRPVLHREPVDEWSRRIGAVLGPSLQMRAAPPLREIALLQELLAALLTGEGNAAVGEADRRWTQRACGLIEASLDGKLVWAGVARQFGLTAEGFRKRFARLTGHSPARYRVGRLIDRACEMMSETRRNDREIAERLGFCDEFYFSRRFKEITGRSPRAFRRSLALRSGDE